jgi:hypothetical protein
MIEDKEQLRSGQQAGIGLPVNPEDGSDILFATLRLTCAGLHGIVSQKVEIFITTTVRTSNM